MEVIGLTGGIGTGKSTASDYLRKTGFAIIDADRIAREVVEPGEPLLEELEQVFGSGILMGDGSLDRKGLAAIVFSDKAKRRQLDQIMHGRIIEVIRQRISSCSKQREYKGIIIDAPLLFETGLEKYCNRVWLLVADKAIRVERVCQRDGVTPQEVESRIDNQLDDTEKRKRADLVIDNSKDKELLIKKLNKILEQGGFVTE